jgi:hypothetical protein
MKVLLDASAGDFTISDFSSIDRLMAKASKSQKRKARFELGGKFDPSYRHPAGADTGKGDGRDHSTSVLPFATAGSRRICAHSQRQSQHFSIKDVR